jgi:hypothetical protein
VDSSFSPWRAGAAGESSFRNADDTGGGDGADLPNRLPVPIGGRRALTMDEPMRSLEDDPMCGQV